LRHEGSESRCKQLDYGGQAHQAAHPKKFQKNEKTLFRGIRRRQTPALLREQGMDEPVATQNQYKPQPQKTLSPNGKLAYIQRNSK